MMDHNLIFNNFKKQYMTDGFFLFSLFPVLFREFLRYGANRSIVTEQFIADFTAFFIPNDDIKVKVRAIECITHYSKEFLPTVSTKKEVISTKKEVVEKKELPKVEVKVTSKPVLENNESPKMQYDDYIPTEEEEGDGMYIPEDQRLHIKPEECAPKQYDWDFINRIGVVGLEVKK